MSLDLEQQYQEAQAELSELKGRWAELYNAHGSNRAQLAATPGTEAYRVFHAMAKAKVRFGKLAERRAAKRLAA